MTRYRPAVIVGIAYVVIGRVFALPTDNVHFWRLGAWAVSGAAFATHIGYELIQLRRSPRTTALHAALAVAIGAMGLAVAGMVHSLSTPSGIRPIWLLALVLWPLFAAVPAFCVALVTCVVLVRIRPGRAS